MRGAIFLWVLFSVAFYACEEIGPAIDLDGEQNLLSDTTYVETNIEVAQQKNVLLEEFTGVRCLNCPKGHEVIEDLRHQHGGRFIAISEHSDFLAFPYDDDQDLRNDDANDLSDLLGPVPAKPSAAIDRKIFSGESAKVHTYGKWPAFVDQQLNKTTPVNVSVSADFDEAKKELIISVKFFYTEDVADQHSLSVMLLEDNITTAQLDGNVIDSFYTQNNVLRDVVTSVNGIILSEELQKGRVIIKNFKIENVNEVFVANNLRVIAFVENENEVVQAAEAEVN